MGLLFALLSGALAPFFAIILGWFVKLFNPTLTKEESREQLLEKVPYIIIISVFTFVFSWLGFALMQISAEKLSFRLRARYLK